MAMLLLQRLRDQIEADVTIESKIVLAAAAQCIAVKRGAAGRQTSHASRPGEFRVLRYSVLRASRVIAERYDC